MTPEEVINSYHFKVIKKLLKLNYPFIKDIVLESGGKEINKYNLIFLSVIIDNDKIVEYFNAPLHRWVGMSFNLYGEYSATGLNMFVDIDRSASERVRDDMNETIRRINTSKSLPEDLRLPPGRNFSVLDFHAFPDGGRK